MILINEWRICADTCTLIRAPGDDMQRPLSDVEVAALSADELPEGVVKIPPRSMDVLMMLIEHAGEVVSSEELLDRFWAASVTSDHAVHKVIASLRSALGDSASEPRYIKTLPKRGYMLIAAVQRVARSPVVVAEADEWADDLSSEDTYPPLKRLTAWLSRPVRVLPRTLFSLLALASLITFSVVQLPWQPQGAAMLALEELEATVPGIIPARRIVLLTPQVDDSVPPQLSSRVEGLLASLSVSLARLPDLTVLTPGRGLNSVQEAASVGASHALVTMLHFLDDETRLSLNVVRTDDQGSVYARQYFLDEPMLARIENDVVPELVQSLSIHLDQQRVQEMLAWGTNNASAYLHFVRANFYNNQYNHEDWEVAMNYYERAIQEDPYFVNAYLGKATAANNMAVFSRYSRVEALGLEVMDINRRLALVSQDKDALDTVRAIHLRIEGHNERQQEQEYREWIKRGDAPGFVYSRYALFLIGARLYAEADAMLTLASQGENYRVSPNAAWNFRTHTFPPQEKVDVKVRQLLDRPVHIGILGSAIVSLALNGEYERAESYYRRQASRDLDGVRTHLSRVVIDASTGTVDAADYKGDLFDPQRLEDEDLAFNYGVLHFIRGDFDSAAPFWRDLNPINRRLLFTRLHALETLFPASILEDERYAQLLEEVGIGRSWQRQLMDGIEELSEYTGFELSDVARDYHQEDLLMLRNTGWDRTW